jgi:hypothetical protein
MSGHVTSLDGSMSTNTNHFYAWVKFDSLRKAWSFSYVIVIVSLYENLFLKLNLIWLLYPISRQLAKLKIKYNATKKKEVSNG